MGKIMIIEDDIDVSDRLEAFLRQRDHHVIKSDDAAKVLEDVLQKKIEVDLILTDLKLPNLTGIEFLQGLRRAGFTTPVIVMTATTDVDTALNAIEVGAFDFIAKPLHFQQLEISIERALRFSKLESENIVLKTAIATTSSSPIKGVIGKSPELLKVLDLARRVARGTSNVFITGESGTGKEVIARSIHAMSPRSRFPFIAINCSAIPENLLESELFGHAKGAFTGASDKKIGLFEEADGGTLFLDEIGDMNVQLQAKLLRVIQERKIKRVGENQMRKIDVRIISATYKDLKHEVVHGRFREDLFFRLNVVPIFIPPLRSRSEDILLLAEFFLKKFAALNNSPACRFTSAAKEYLLRQTWPGNVRELENMIERAVVLTEKEILDIPELRVFDELEMPPQTKQLMLNQELNVFESGQRVVTIDQVIKRYIQYALEQNGGAKEKTARDLGIDRKTLYRKIQEMETEGKSRMQQLN